jgi:predicted nucleic acid-binding protein
MILYLDSSAIVKRYVDETGSALIRDAVEHAEVVGTTVISRAEVIAALRKAVRADVIGETEGEAAVRSFNRGWRDLVRTRITERLVKHASELARAHGLRGYDSVQLASAAAWQQAIGFGVTLATFDLRLWHAGRAVGLRAFPENLPEIRRH